MRRSPLFEVNLISDDFQRTHKGMCHLVFENIAQIQRISIKNTHISIKLASSKTLSHLRLFQPSLSETTESSGCFFSPSSSLTSYLS